MCAGCTLVGLNQSCVPEIVIVIATSPGPNNTVASCCESVTIWRSRSVSLKPASALLGSSWSLT
jgi:hypothetical protein